MINDEGWMGGLSKIQFSMNAFLFKGEAFLKYGIRSSTNRARRWRKTIDTSYGALQCVAKMRCSELNLKCSGDINIVLELSIYFP